ncbi:hypothetical protein FKM82_010009 [Ascaphus truei]
MTKNMLNLTAVARVTVFRAGAIGGTATTTAPLPEDYRCRGSESMGPLQHYLRSGGLKLFPRPVSEDRKSCYIYIYIYTVVYKPSQAVCLL